MGAGHKLLAVWGFGSDSKAVMKSNGREHFAKPLTQLQVSALEAAQCVALAPPGAAYIFSGACAHTVCNVGFSAPRENAVPEPSLVASSYEAFVNLNLRHLKAAVDTFDAVAESDSEDEDLEDFKRDMAEGAGEIHKRLNRGEVQEECPACSAVVRRRGGGVLRGHRRCSCHAALRRDGNSHHIGRSFEKCCRWGRHYNLHAQGEGAQSKYLNRNFQRR